MKKISVVLIISVFGIISLNAQLEVSTSGNVGIKGSPYSSYALRVNGDVVAQYLRVYSELSSTTLSVDGDDYSDERVVEISGDNYGYPVVDITGESVMDYGLRVDHGIYGTVYGGSDIRLKKDIQSLVGKDILSKLQLLDGKIYKLKSDEELATRLSERMPNKDFSDVTTRKYYGLIAQDVEQYFPDLVKTDSAGLKAINYSGMIPLLLEAIKEQQKQIEAFQANISQLKSLASLTEEDAVLSQAILYQNKPNPYSENTTIAYNIPIEASNAMICIYDLNGTQLKCYHISQSGMGELRVQGNELNPGMYLYSLLVNGQLIDTKQMILTN